MIGVRKKPAGAKGAKSRRGAAAKAAKRTGGSRPPRPGQQTAPIAVQRVTADSSGRATSSRQAKARAKARKAKAPKVIRIPLRERIINRLAEIDIRPHVWVSKVPFVVLVIGALGVGLAVTLWLSTDAAERSYQLGSQRKTNEVLTQRKEALERDVLRAESAPALADSARDLGMIPSRDIAHLVQDQQGNWQLVGAPKPAAGAAPPPLNAPIPDEPNAVPKAGNSVEVPVQLPPVPAPVVAVPHMPAPGQVQVPVPNMPAPQAVPQRAPVPDAAPAAPAPAPAPAAPAAPAVVAPPDAGTPPAPADAPQATNGTNSPATGEQFSPVATTKPGVPA